MKAIVAILLLTSITRVCSAQSYIDKISKHRATYLSDLTSGNAPLSKKDLKNVDFYQPDTSYIVWADAKLLTGERPFTIPAFDGEGREYIRYARLHFSLKGKNLELTLYKSISLTANPAYKDYLFLPFTDLTNGESTYGGGRYIDLRTGDIVADKLQLDFNIAYNPYCAFSSGYRCPVPPRENNLELAIEAGEKKYKGEKKH